MPSTAGSSPAHGATDSSPRAIATHRGTTPMAATQSWISMAEGFSLIMFALANLTSLNGKIIEH